MRGRRAAAGHQPRRRRRGDPRRLPRLGGQLRSARWRCWPTPGSWGWPCRSTPPITRRNVHQIDAMAELLAGQGIAMWSVFFLVPVGRGIEEQRIAPEEYETVFERLWHHAQRQPYAVKTTEAPHYRRFVLQQRRRSAGRARSRRRGCPPGHGAAGRRRRQGHDVRQPHRRNLSGRLPAALLRAVPARLGGRRLSETSRLPGPARSRPFKGRCGVCEYRHVCGGSRARAYAVTGDYLETEPDCVYVPAKGGSAPFRHAHERLWTVVGRTVFPTHRTATVARQGSAAIFPRKSG